MSHLFSASACQDIDDTLHEALAYLGDFTHGPWCMRCVEFHLGKSPFSLGESFGWHLHKELQIEIPLSGEFKFSVRKSKTFTIRPGNAMILPPDALHRWECTRPGTMLGILLTAAPDANSIVRPLATSIKPAAEKPPFLPRLLETFQDEFRFTINSREFLLKRLASWMYLIVTQIMDSCLQPPSLSDDKEKVPLHASRRQRVVSKMIRYIDANIGGDLSMGNFEKAIGLGSRQIHRLFSEVTGLSCHRYIMNRRLEVARAKLLGNPNASIKGVAYACGFASPAHFSTKFKSAFGISPNEVR